MEKKQRLAHEKHSKSRILRKCKKLFFSVLMAAPLLSCAGNAHAIPRTTPVFEAEKTKERTNTQKRDSALCIMKGAVLEYTLTDGTKKIVPDLLEKGEQVIGIRCNDQFASILTNTSLISVPGKRGSEKSEGGASLSFLQTRKDMSRIYKIGLVAWDHGLDRVFFLDQSGQVWEIPVISKGSTIPVHNLPEKTNKAEMKFHSGFLFIAPVGGKMIVMKITDKARYVELNLPTDMDGSVFFFKKNRFYYGKKGSKKVEIRIKGSKPIDVKLGD